MRHTILLLVAVLLCTGCGSVAQPTATFRSADIADVSADGIALKFNVDVANPNSFDLPISGTSYNLRLGGVSVMDGTAEPTASIPASGKLPVAIPVVVSFDRLLKAKDALAASRGNVPYELDGTMEFSAGPLKALGQGIRVPLNFSGTLPLRDAVKDPVALLKTPAGRAFAEAVIGKGLIGDLLGR